MFQVDDGGSWVEDWVDVSPQPIRAFLVRKSSDNSKSQKLLTWDG